ncbi:MAG TPA: hypothetical protein PLX95_02795 [bacterium]|nr:hypothetical protein [bacterium]
MSWLFGKKDTEDRKEPWQIAIDKEPWQIAIDKEEERKMEEKRAKKFLDEQECQEAYQRNIQKLGERFKCHCCGKPSKIPGKTQEQVCYDTTCTVDDWSKPDDLYHCDQCGLLTCESCLYKGICKTCALKIVSKH